MECEKLQGDARGFEGYVITAAQLHPKDRDKCRALYFKVEALADLIGEEGAPGWTLPPLADGRVPTQHAVFAAAAFEPLVERNGELRFRRAPFLKRVLELAEAEGGIQ